MRDKQPVFMISVAARLAGVHQQTLRIYERKMLLKPSRTEGSTRLYSEDDIARLKLIQELTQEKGVNLAGVKMIFEMMDEMADVRAELTGVQRRMDEIKREMLQDIDLIHRSYKRELVVIPKGKLVKVIKK